MNARTYLFVPANRPERFAKALASGADAVVFDLEDAVAPAAKSEARGAIAARVETAEPRKLERVVVRVNDASSPAFGDDLRLARDVRIAAIMLPKAEHPEQIAEVASALPGARVLALVESARGIERANALATSAGVVRLAFGTLDFALDLDLDIAGGNEPLAYAASRLAIASRLGELASPVAGVTPRIDDETRLLDDLAFARSHGFGAKLCIHPRQVAPIHAAMQPTAAALEWARRVLAAEAASPGAAQLDGRMIDRPVVLQAQRTLGRTRI